LLIVGTYRPVEVLTREHPLKAIKQELQVHGQCEELALDFLSEPNVAEYLTRRFSAPSPASAEEGRGEDRLPATLRKLSRIIHQRTDGNALFMVNVVNDLVAQGVVVQTNGGWELQGEAEARALRTPVNLRQLIEHQIARVGLEERQVLETACVAGAEFSAATVAAGTEHSTEAVEAQCDALSAAGAIPAGAGDDGVAGWDYRGALWLCPCVVSRSVVRADFGHSADALASADWGAGRASLWRPSERNRR
jgi:predicted ATPase